MDLQDAALSILTNGRNVSCFAKDGLCAIRQMIGLLGGKPTLKNVFLIAGWSVLA
jgi:hypothetical protein